MLTLFVLALIALVLWGVAGIVTNQVTGGVSWGDMPPRRPETAVLETSMRPLRLPEPESMEDAS